MVRAVYFLAGLMALSVWAEAGPSEDELRLGDGLYARSFYEMALKEYERVLEAYPVFEGRDAVLFRAAESARRLDRPGRARELYEALLKEGHEVSYGARARLRLADMALEKKAYQAARGIARALLRENPEPEFAAAGLHLLAEVAEATGEVQEARERRLELMERYPEDPHAAVAAMVLARSGTSATVEQRRGWYALALGNPPSPDLEVEALWGLGMLALDAGDAGDAAERLHRLWQMHPDHSRVQTGLLTIAWALMQAERYEEALAVAGSAPERRRAEQPDSWLYLEAVSLRNTQRGEEARARYERLMEEFPGTRFRGRVAFDLALMYAEQEEYGRVMGLAEDLLTVPERREDVLWLLAESARALGRTAEALERYAELAAQTPATARTADAAFQRARLLREVSALEGAAALVEFAAAFPEDARAFSSLRAAGATYVERGDAAAARGAWQRALERYPEDPAWTEVGYGLGMLALREGRGAEARVLLEAVLAREGEGVRSAAAGYWLAMLAADEGAEDAEVLLEEALERELTPVQGRNVRVRLAGLRVAGGDVEGAMDVYVELLEEPGAPGLSDSRLVWLLRRAEEAGELARARRVAAVMAEEGRSEAVRELGYYGLASVAMAEGETERAVAAWEAGLALGGEHAEAAEAALALGETYRAAGRLADAEGRLEQALRWAAAAEDAEVQARAMMGLGEAAAAREDWGEAARRFLGIAVLFDDPEWSPRALHAAAGAFERSGQPEEAENARAELRRRYPAFTMEP